jgi:hypothetical protein
MSTTRPTAPSVNGRFIPGLLIGLAVGTAATWGFGLFCTSYHPIEEAKLCHLALSQHSASLQPQTREYLKGRLYWNASTWISPSWLQDWDIDFGPVDESVLGGISFIKGPSTYEEVYRDALQKVPSPKKRG